MSKVLHESAKTHVSGRSEFIGEMRLSSDALHVALFVSPIACGEIHYLGYHRALETEGVVGVYTAKDIPGQNELLSEFKDQPLLADQRVHYIGEPICVVVAETEEIAREAIKKITVNIKDEDPILTLDQAIQKDFFLSSSRWLSRNTDIDQALSQSPLSLSGEFVSGGQEHFYLETQSAYVVPSENHHLDVFSSTQHPTEVQHSVAHALALKYSQVTCSVKRLGGAFGGKESQAAHFAALCSLAAFKTNRPCLLQLKNEEDINNKEN